MAVNYPIWNNPIYIIRVFTRPLISGDGLASPHDDRQSGGRVAVAWVVVCRTLRSGDRSVGEL